MSRRFYQLAYLLVLVTIALPKLSAQTIVKQNGKWGLMNKNGEAIARPEYDSITGNTYAPNFFIVRSNGKYTYLFFRDRENGTWLPENKQQWIWGSFEFDTLYLRLIEGPDYSVSKESYACLIYRQQGKLGFLILETQTVSGEGIFTEIGFHISGMGLITKRELLFDQVPAVNPDHFFITRNGNVYGLYDPVANEEYSPQFDTLPVFKGTRKYYVRKNQKWGAVYLDKKMKTFHYNMPCHCNEVSEVWPGLFACSGAGDTISFRDSTSRTNYTPLLNGLPLLFNSDSFSIHADQYGFGPSQEQTRPVTILVYSLFAGDKNTAPVQVYFINTKNKTATAFNNKNAKYSVLQSSENGLVEMAEKTGVNSQTKYSYYNIETGEFRFSYTIESTVSRSFTDYSPANCKESEERRFIRFYTYSSSAKNKTIGYYDFRKEIYSRKKPRCRA